MQTTARKDASHHHMYLEKGRDKKWRQAWKKQSLETARNDQSSRLKKSESSPRWTYCSGVITKCPLAAPTYAPPCPSGEVTGWVKSTTGEQSTCCCREKSTGICPGITELSPVMLLSYSSTTCRLKSLFRLSFKTPAWLWAWSSSWLAPSLGLDGVRLSEGLCPILCWCCAELGSLGQTKGQKDPELHPGF